MKETELPKKEEQSSDSVITPDKQKAPEASVENSYAYTQLFPFFDIEGGEAGNPQTKERIRFIWDFFKNKKESVADALWKIKIIERKIGLPEFGTRRYEKLYRYLKILNDKKEIERQLSAYEDDNIKSDNTDISEENTQS